ncbi:hypothetical protein JCM11491_006762 [Sporobolomyces phaffii]
MASTSLAQAAVTSSPHEPMSGLILEDLEIPANRTPSPEPAPRDSRPLLTLASLPPELLAKVFDSVPRHPFPEDLASLCRVSRRFLAIARPILYHEVHLEFTERYDDDDPFEQLCRTLLQVEACSGLVRSLRVTLENCTLEDVATFGDILSRLEKLATIRTSWLGSTPHLIHGPHGPYEAELEDAPDMVEEFVSGIIQHGQRLRSLKLAQLRLTENQTRRLLTSLPNLETLAGRLAFPFPASQPLPDLSQLRHLTLVNAITPSDFASFVVPLSDSLCSLGIHINPSTGVLDLSRFVHLETLLLVTDNCSGVHQKWTSASSTITACGPTVPSDQQVRAILRTCRFLPLRTVSVTTGCYTFHNARLPIAPLLFLDLLPRSLVHLSTVHTLFHEQYDPSAQYNPSARALNNERIRRLHRITFIPEKITERYDSDFWDEDHGACLRLKRECERYRSGLQVEMKGHKWSRLHAGFALDPDRPDDELEYEDIELENEEFDLGGDGPELIVNYDPGSDYCLSSDDEAGRGRIAKGWRGKSGDRYGLNFLR